MSETKDGGGRIQDLPAKLVSGEQGQAVKGGAEPVGGKGKQPPKPAEPVG